MESLINLVIAAECNARNPRRKARSLREAAVHVCTEHLDILVEAVNGRKDRKSFEDAIGHAYLFLNEVTRKIEQMIYLYERGGKFVVPIYDVERSCSTLAEAEGYLHDWAVSAGIIR